MKFIAIIPARYASTRFPGKPLAMLGGKTVIQRVVEQVKKAVEDVYVATDDDRIYNAVKDFGANVVMTRSDHKSGTDRVCEALQHITEKEGLTPDVVINIQGDEPFIRASQIETVKDCFQDDATQIATLGKPFESIDAVCNPNSPKIVLNNNSCAMYFSRSPIPFIRGKEQSQWLNNFTFLKHIGMYAYRTDTLRQITQLPQSPLEIAESLEQLRWLQNGYTIKVGLTDVETIGIDTPEDLQKAEEFLTKGNTL